MDSKQFIDMLRSRQSDVERLVGRVLPIKIGALAKAQFQQNFRLGGFVNNGLTKWRPTQRQLNGGDSAASKYGPLLSSRNMLYSSIAYTPFSGYVVIGTGVPYAGIHNQGGTVSPTVTGKMRKFAWAMYYKNGGCNGKGEPAAAGKWKALALTKKKKLAIKMPQRQFIGESAELSAAIGQTISNEVQKLFER